MTLLKGQFQLGNVVFGLPEDEIVILEDGLETGYAATRDQDAEMPRGDGILMGIDYLDSPTYAFTLGVKSKQALDDLVLAWRADDARKSPGKYTELRFNRFGEEQVVFGRPRRFAVVAPKTHADDWFQVECDFRPIDPYVYSGEEQSLTMGLIEQASTGGLVLPDTLPFALDASTITRKGIVTVEGYTDTPVKVRIFGPSVDTTLNDAKVTAPGFHVELNTSIGPNQMVEIDTRTKTVTSDGLSLAGYLSPASRLGTRLKPGSTEFTFTGNDNSNTSRVEFVWRSAAYSI